MKNQKVRILSFLPNKGSTCEAFIKLYGGPGVQCEWISRQELDNLIPINIKTR